MPPVPAPIETLAAAIQAVVDPVAAAIQAVLDVLAATIQTIVDTVTTMLQHRRAAVVAERLLMLCAPVEAVFDAIAAAIQPVLDMLAATVQAIVDAITAPVQALFDAVAAIGGKGAARGQQQDAGQGNGQGVFHWILLEVRMACVKKNVSECSRLTLARADSVAVMMPIGANGRTCMSDGFVALYIFMLAAIAGHVIISRVPVILHTPLMSGSNFIHGIVLIGAMVVLGHADTTLGKAIGFVAVLLGAGNAAGGYVVTERMLDMFKSSKKAETK